MSDWRVKALILVILVTWEVVGANSSRVMMITSSPLRVVEAILREAKSETLYTACAYSIFHVTAGVLIGGVCGVTAGIIFGMRGRGIVFLGAVEAMLRPIPPLACLPFFILVLGTSSATAVAIVAIGVFWISVITTRESIRAIPPDVLEMARAYGYHRGIGLLWRILIPAASPGIFAGIKTSVGQGWTFVVAAEMAGAPGIGQRLWEAAGLLANDTVVAYMAVLVVLNRGSDLILDRFDRAVFSWRLQ